MNITLDTLPLTDRADYFFASTYGLDMAGAAQLAAYERDGGSAIRVQILMNLDHCTLDEALAIVEATDADMSREELAETGLINQYGEPVDPYAPLGCCAVCGDAAWTTAAAGLLCPRHAEEAFYPFADFAEVA